MFWRLFRGRMWPVGRSAASPPNENAAWWRDANAASAEPTPEAISRLHDLMASPTGAPDENERQEEMIEGLRGLLALTDNGHMPVVPTQHRVIGTDVCHFVVPAALVDPSNVAGKLFLTSGRIVFAGSSVVSLPWHRVHRIDRADRDLAIMIAGTVNEIVIRCNTYGDALAALHLAKRLRQPGARR